MSFPQTPLPLFAELLLGGTWTDITSDVSGPDGTSGIDIERGITSSGGSLADRGTCALTLFDDDGRYSARNPRGPYYGLLGRNTQLRTGVLTSWSWLGMPYDTAVTASTPDASALHITGDLDIRVDVEMANWVDIIEVPLAGRWDEASNCSWLLTIGTGGATLQWTTGGVLNDSLSAYSETLPVAPGWGRLAIRASLDVNNGAGGHAVTWYTAPTIAGPWTQLGTPAGDLDNPGTTSVFAGTRPMEVGTVTGWVTDTPGSTGRIYAAQLRNAAGTVVATPDFTSLAPNTTSWSDTAGSAWTAPAGGVTNRLERFTGEVSSWPPSWETGGFNVTVPITASGILQRLGQGQPPLASALRRQSLADTSLRAYWPMEDEPSATSAASALSMQSPLRLSGVTFAQDTTLAGSGALPVLAGASSLSGTVPAGAAGDWSVAMLLNLPSLPATLETLLTVNSSGGAAAQVRVLVSVTTVRVQALAGDGTVLGSADTGTTGLTGGWGVLQVRSFTSGGSVGYYVTTAAGSAFTTLSGSPGWVTAVTGTWGTDFTGMGIGHLMVGGGFSEPSLVAAQGNPGYDVPDRIYRTASDAGIPVSVIGIENESETLGPEPQDTALAVLEDAAAADEGLLYEAREFVGLRYRNLTSLYCQPSALDLPYTATPQPLLMPLGPPTDDDQRLRNRWTINRTDGSGATVTATDGTLTPALVGTYADSGTLNLYTDDRAAPHAGWRVHLGTWDEARYPAVTIELAKDPSLMEAVSRIDTGSRIRITGPLPEWLPPGPIDLMVVGYQEILAQFTWRITFACVPYGPYASVGVVGDSTYGRADTAGSQLGSTITATGTSLTLTSTGARWIDSATYASEFPFDLLIGGGERVTVTAITGTSSPQIATVTRAVNGISRSWSSATAVSLADPAYVAL